MKTTPQLTGILVFAAAVSMATRAAADEISEVLKTNVEIERVFGREHPGPYKHPASLTQLDNGDLYVAYYGGAGEYSNDTAIYGSRRVQGYRSWSAPEIIADTPRRAEGNPVVWQAPDGKVWLFYVNLAGETWSDAIVKAKISADGAKTWSDSFMLTDQRGSMVRGQPIVLIGGDYLLPMYHETGGDREQTGADTQSYFLRYHPGSDSWTPSSRIASAAGNLQPQVVQLDEQNLFCFMRRGGGYGPESSGYILRSESTDGGQTWSPARETEFKNPNSAVDLARLRNGHIVLVYNDHMYRRTPLTVAISTDNGQTFPHRREIAGGDNTFAYPYLIQSRDGKLLVLYTTNDRTTIMLAEFDEAAVLEYQP